MKSSMPTQGAAKRLRVDELSFAMPSSWNQGGLRYRNQSPQFVDGKVVTDAALTRVEELPADTALDADAACDSHSWGDNALFPTHASKNAISAKSLGAVGDGITDDSAALQAAVAQAASGGHVLFLPRGVYRTTTTLRIPAGVRLAGLARHLTTIVASDTMAPVGAELRRSASLASAAGPLEPAYDTPAILSFLARGDGNATVAASAMGSGPSRTPETVLFGVTLVVPIDNSNGNASMVEWRTGAQQSGFNVWRQMWTTSVPMCGQWYGTDCMLRFLNHPPHVSSYARIEGAEASVRVFVFFQEDGGMNDKGRSASPFSRKLLVRGTRAPVQIYQLNGEHGQSTAYSEFVDTANVSIFGSKSEGGGAVLFVRDSTSFASYSHGGLASCNAYSPLPPGMCDKLAPCPWRAALYRILNSTDTRLVNVLSMGVNNRSGMVFESNGKPPPHGVNRTAGFGDMPAVWFSTPQPL